MPGERGFSDNESFGVPEDKMKQYPENLTVGNVAYYVAAPTLSYQLTYPRSTGFRFLWFLGCASRCIQPPTDALQ